MCGEVAGKHMAAVLLRARGDEVLSMNVTSLPRVKDAVRSITASDAKALLVEVRRMDSGQAVEERLGEFFRERGLQQMVPAPVD